MMFVFFNILGFKVSHKLPKNYYLLPRERIRAVAALFLQQLLKQLFNYKVYPL
jgi:hypothetical protein